jgi:rhodanese-related sulfurtransferase
VVEVLGSEEFDQDHLPGAINLPLRNIDAEAKSRLDAGRPVLVYCWDSA